ncbi:MAG: hypothetical protein F6K31_20155 [Symploca sp. SIO2G7]|nr:hypothetical protein [Symploca sp. SIO2G7]
MIPPPQPFFPYSWYIFLPSPKGGGTYVNLVHVTEIFLLPTIELTINVRLVDGSNSFYYNEAADLLLKEIEAMNRKIQSKMEQ